MSSRAESSEDEESFHPKLAFKYLPVLLTAFNITNKKRKKKAPPMLWRCFECNKDFTDKQTLKTHQMACAKMKKLKKSWPCNKCDRSYTQQSNLCRHVSAAHKKANVEDKSTTNEEPGAKRPWSCDKCDKSYTRRSNLMRHVKETHVTKRKPSISKNTRAKNAWPCDKCDRSYTHRFHLLRHKTLTHRQDSKEHPEKGLKSQKHKCPFCTKLLSDILNHCRMRHKIFNPEKIFFNDGTPMSSKELVEEKNRNNDNVCRLCQFKEGEIRFDNADLLATHYDRDHNIKPDYQEVIKLLCAVQKPKGDAKTKVVFEERSAIDGEKVNITSEPVKNMTSTSNYSKQSCKTFQKDVEGEAKTSHPLKICIKRDEGSQKKEWKILNKTAKDQNETKTTHVNDRMQSEDEETDKENGSNRMENDDATTETSESESDSGSDLEMSSASCDVANKKITRETEKSKSNQIFDAMNINDVQGNYKRPSTPDLQRILEGHDEEDSNPEQELSKSFSGDNESAKTNEERNILGEANAEMHQQDNSDEVSSVASEDEEEPNVTSSEESGSENEEWPNTTVAESHMRMTAQMILTRGHTMLNTINY